MRVAHPPLVALCLLVPLLCACSDDPRPATPEHTPVAPAPPDPAVPEGPPVVLPEDTQVPTPPDRDALQKQQEEWRAKMNEHGRGLIDSFRRRVYDPVRDGHLTFAEGVAQVTAGEASGTFRIVFDVARPEGERVSVVPEGDVSALPERSDVQVRQFATAALEGPYRTVVQYLPPIDLLLTMSKDGTAKIVTAPPHKHDLQVSYRFDDRELISVRGISVRPSAEITHYEWTFFHGRYLMSRFWIYGTNGTCDLEYDDRGTSGVVLMRHALLRKEERSFDVAFSWERVEVGE